MKLDKKKKIKIILLISWIVLIIFGVLLFTPKKEKTLKDERVDPVLRSEVKEDYNFFVEDNLEREYSPLYQCKSNTIPNYLNDLANNIDQGLERVESSHFVRWVKDGSEEILVYNIDNANLNIYLESYPEQISFTNVEDFVGSYLNPLFKYTDIQVQVEEDTEIYTANRVVDGEEIITGYGYSDYYYVENGYLTSARVLLAELSKTEFVLPLIKNEAQIQYYLNQKEYPKDVIVHTSEIIQLTPFNYEIEYEPVFSYEQCVVNEMAPKLYFTSCNNNYIYYSYKIEGTCDVSYEKELYTVPFQGFINAVEQEYVKSTE